MIESFSTNVKKYWRETIDNTTNEKRWWLAKTNFYQILDISLAKTLEIHAISS